ncbi:MAG TPA: radical SAM protein [Desulfomonilaceae bacterium]|nr:radical SAM protein [Desulfomonilaceae bacterium]
MMKDQVVLSQTDSVCPECLACIPAIRVARGDDVILKKKCPKHGEFEAVIWRGIPSYASWSRPKPSSHPRMPLTTVDRGCPWDCGLCPDHRQQTCCVLIEVTQRCDLKCKVCFADAGKSDREGPDLSEIQRMFETLLAAGGPYNIQLSGGEPTLRDDLPEIVALGRSLGFDFIQVNTNGLRMAREPAYVNELKDAGLSCVFLQFDGLDDEICKRLRGRALFREKEQAIAHCMGYELGVILVPTLVPDVNIHQIGAIIEYALGHLPGVRGVHFQPVSYFGRYPAERPQNGDRITLPEIIVQIEKQTNGKIKTESFSPPAAENCYCSFHGNFVLMPNGELKPWTKPDSGSSCCRGEEAGLGVSRAQDFQKRFWAPPQSPCCSSEQGLSLGGWDLFLERVHTHSFCLSGMAFQDAWNLDLQRLKECHLHVLHPDGRIIPFCAFNLTDSGGRPIYRNS